MTIRQHDDSVSRNADTGNQKLNVTDTKRVLATARDLHRKHPEMLSAWLRAVDPELARVADFWRGSIARVAQAEAKKGGAQ